MNAERLSLNGRWHFRADPYNAGVREQWHRRPPPTEGSWQTLQVPGDWEQHGRDGYAGVGWYRRDFELTRPPPAAPLGLCLAGIDDTATVWVNSTELETDARGSRRFVGSLARAANPGINTIAIRVPDRGVPGGILLGAWIGPDGDIDVLRRGQHASSTARPSAGWVSDAVIYEVYLRSFSSLGDFRGLRRRLDDLRALGVTVIWLMPIHPVGKLRRKGTLGSPYAVADYHGVNPEFGTLDDFKSLLDAAHERGLRLIIDLVANHTAWDNPLVREHPDWFARDQHGEIRCPLDDWTDVAQLDYRVPELRRYMTDLMLYWVRDVGVDGFRCDVAGMVPTDFWEHAREELDAVRPIMMLAEDDQPAQHVRAFDLTYDWRTYRALGRLCAGTLNPASVATILANEQLDLPTGSLRLRFSSNHDLCAWHRPGMERYGPDAARAAALLTFALPGVPLVYNGQEAGNRRKLDLFERVPLDWTTDDHGLKALFASLARLRRTHGALRRGDVQTLDHLAEPGVIGLCRTWRDETTYVLVNCTRQRRRVALGQLPRPPSETLLGEALRGGPGRAGRIDLPPLGCWIGAAG